jgi:hypothetical protein
MDTINAMDTIIDKFKLYSLSHPNLSSCWITYLALKKRHYDKNLLEQCEAVLDSLKNGYTDLTRNDIVSVLFYKRSV